MPSFKYIIINKLEHEVPILFDDLIEHREIAEDMPVIAAGFCKYYFENGITQISTFGESISLKTKSRVQDATIIRRMLSQT